MHINRLYMNEANFTVALRFPNACTITSSQNHCNAICTNALPSHNIRYLTIRQVLPAWQSSMIEPDQAQNKKRSGWTRQHAQSWQVGCQSSRPSPAAIALLQASKTTSAPSISTLPACTQCQIVFMCEGLTRHDWQPTVGNCQTLLR